MHIFYMGDPETGLAKAINTRFKTISESEIERIVTNRQKLLESIDISPEIEPFKEVADHRDREFLRAMELENITEILSALGLVSTDIYPTLQFDYATTLSDVSKGLLNSYTNVPITRKERKNGRFGPYQAFHQNDFITIIDVGTANFSFSDMIKSTHIGGDLIFVNSRSGNPEITKKIDIDTALENLEGFDPIAYLGWAFSFPSLKDKVHSLRLLFEQYFHTAPNVRTIPLALRGHHGKTLTIDEVDELRSFSNETYLKNFKRQTDILSGIIEQDQNNYQIALQVMQRRDQLKNYMGSSAREYLQEVLSIEKMIINENVREAIFAISNIQELERYRKLRDAERMINSEQTGFLVFDDFQIYIGGDDSFAYEDRILLELQEEHGLNFGIERSQLRKISQEGSKRYNIITRGFTTEQKEWSTEDKIKYLDDHFEGWYNLYRLTFDKFLTKVDLKPDSKEGRAERIFTHDIAFAAIDDETGEIAAMSYISLLPRFQQMAIEGDYDPNTIYGNKSIAYLANIMVDPHLTYKSHVLNFMFSELIQKTLELNTGENGYIHNCEIISGVHKEANHAHSMFLSQDFSPVYLNSTDARARRQALSFLHLTKLGQKPGDYLAYVKDLNQDRGISVIKYPAAVPADIEIC